MLEYRMCTEYQSGIKTTMTYKDMKEAYRNARRVYRTVHAAGQTARIDIARGESVLKYPWWVFYPVCKIEVEETGVFITRWAYTAKE